MHSSPGHLSHCMRFVLTGAFSCSILEMDESLEVQGRAHVRARPALFLLLIANVIAELSL